ncbi:hypothetical protein H4582DRAFT_2006530 [Lactarius indigo]|nr:hypothetical protein H4582DRAFT_2006530 [Lactarius indigo]
MWLFSLLVSLYLEPVHYHAPRVFGGRYASFPRYGLPSRQLSSPRSLPLPKRTGRMCISRWTLRWTPVGKPMKS